MVETTQHLLREALALEPNERAQLAEMLWDSLDATDPETDRLWVEEANRRLAAYQAGSSKALTPEEFFRGMKSS